MKIFILSVLLLLSPLSFAKGIKIYTDNKSVELSASFTYDKQANKYISIAPMTVIRLSAENADIALVGDLQMWGKHSVSTFPFKTGASGNPGRPFFATLEDGNTYTFKFNIGIIGDPIGNRVSLVTSLFGEDGTFLSGKSSSYGIDETTRLTLGERYYADEDAGITNFSFRKRYINDQPEQLPEVTPVPLPPSIFLLFSSVIGMIAFRGRSEGNY